MTSELILHEATRLQIEHFIENPAHAVLLVGPDGIGKTALAEALMAALIKVPVPELAFHPYILRIAPDGASISIEAIRGVQKFLQLKTVGTQPLRRVVLIEHAQTLTTEAQNAYLKLLEEPPADTLLILTVNNARALLPTIASRLQTITVHAPSESQLEALLKASQKDEKTLRQAYFLSGGLPGLLVALNSGDETHPLLAGVETAKSLLQKPVFERLALIDALSKQKELVLSALEALARIAQAGIAAAAVKQDAARLKQWHRIRKSVVEASQSLERSANAKLTLSNLFLQL